ncbi:MAG: hypothetical protein GWO07_01335 [Candidatus Dadabacteria bacterium]|nr:hypothetical protein [Candidatus Dadabacteria bacterium]NIS07417.1 hypothetical protein [Candidatus Dadabacteria bacterium]NIV41607.1 hypothetical protein [Candidatus Dadabacteria bacterium]NIX14610.1 hypothetical protein [Candidatus Dadabacteria bacterium]NIY21073.1 hypothetical protein [Candidatus Dadabacteria bacterium]
MRAKFLELIGLSVNPKAINLLKEELASEHYEMRMWAYNALLHSESKKANKIAKEYRENNPDEDFIV